MKITPFKLKEEGTHHYGKEFFELDEINPAKNYKAIDLINLLRARTFPPHKSSFFIKDGIKYYVEVKITKEFLRIIMIILFRTNAGKEGLGHLNRIYALYLAFKIQPDFQGYFIVNNSAKEKLNVLNIPSSQIITLESYKIDNINIMKEINPNIIIVDTYKASSEYFYAINQEIKCPIILFDDFNLYSDIEIDILINGNIHAKNIDYKKKIEYKRALFGPEYLVMNPDFWNIQATIPHKINKLLITCGGADPRNIMVKFVNWLREQKFTKNLVIGPYFEKEQIDTIEKIIDPSFSIVSKPLGLKNLISESDIVITASGSTIYEVLSLKRIPIVYIIADDQEMIANELEKCGVINIGWYYEINQKVLEDALDRAVDQAYGKSLEELYSKFDGNGASRVVSEIMKYYTTYIIEKM